MSLCISIVAYHAAGLDSLQTKYKPPKTLKIIPSRVSGRGYKIGPVCVSVCVSVCQRSHGWTVWATNLKFGVDIAFDNILDEFRGQGQRSKVKVAILKNLDFRTFCSETRLDCRELLCHDIWRHVTSQRDVVTSRDVLVWRHDVTWHYGVTCWLLEGLFVWNSDKRASRGRARQRSGVFIEYCNYHEFSLHSMHRWILQEHSKLWSMSSRWI